MRFAKIRNQKGLVEANDKLHRTYDYYLCPYCGGRVFLRAGEKRDAHFAHYSGEGTPECELYNPGEGGTGELDASIAWHRTGDLPAKAVEDNPSEPGLCLDPDSATLYLRVPEIPLEEMGATPLRSLQEALVVVKVANQRAGQITGFELRPGTGRARLEVQPAVSNYSLVPEGVWPSSIGERRWLTSSSGLTVDGTLFRLRHGEWTRLRRRSLVEWGETLFLVGPTHMVSPIALTTPRALGQAFQGVSWKVWRLKLPLYADSKLEAWLYRLGYWVVPPSWSIRLVRVPDSLNAQNGRRRFTAGRPVLAELRPPTGDKKVGASLTFRMVRHDTTVTAPSEGGAYLRLETTGGGIATVALADDKRSTLTYEVLPGGNLDGLRQALTAVPRLRLRVGGVLLEPWAAAHNLAVGAEGIIDDVEFVGGIDEMRLLVAWGSHEPTVVERDISARRATQLLQELLGKGEATNIIVDAGGLGTIRLAICAEVMAQCPEAIAGQSRVANWASVVARAQGRVGGSSWAVRQAGTLGHRTQLLALRGGANAHLVRTLRASDPLDAERGKP